MEMNPESQSEIILYQTEDNRTRIEVRLENDTVWLTQNQMAELFQTSIPNISMHIRNLFNPAPLALMHGTRFENNERGEKGPVLDRALLLGSGVVGDLPVIVT